MNAVDLQWKTSSVYGAVQLGYALVDFPRLAEWKRFAADGIGMAIAEDLPTVLALRTDDHARRLIVLKAGQEDLALGWQMASQAALDVVLARLTSRGVAIEPVASEEAELRGVERFWRFVGPKRQAFELFVEPKLMSDPPKIKPSGFVTGARGLGHVAITTRKPDAMVRFWRDVFDAKISDFIEDRINGVDLNFTFLRVNPRHHSVAVAATKGLAMDPFPTKIQHLEMQVATLDDVGEAYRRCRALGVRIMMAVGQHPNDRDVSFYSMSPSGFYFEVGWSSAGDEDIESWPQTTHQGVSVWGHKPQDQTFGDRLAQMRNGLTSLLRQEYSPF